MASSWGSAGHQAILAERVKDGTITADERRRMIAGNGRQRINPQFWEWLMGYPCDWTLLPATKLSAIASSLPAQLKARSSASKNLKPKNV